MGKTSARIPSPSSGERLIEETRDTRVLIEKREWMLCNSRLYHRCSRTDGRLITYMVHTVVLYQVFCNSVLCSRRNMLVIVVVVMVVLLVSRGKSGVLAAPLEQSVCTFVTHGKSSNFDESLWAMNTHAHGSGNTHLISLSVADVWRPCKGL